MPSLRILAAIVFTLCLLIPAGAASSKPNDAKADLEAKFLKKTLALRKSPNVSGTMYLRIGTNEYVCWQKPSGLFPLRQEVPNVTIKGVRKVTDSEVIGKKWDDSNPKFQTLKNLTVPLDSWAFTISHPFLGKGEIRITRSSGELPDNLEEVAMALGYILKGEGLNEPKLFLAHEDSKLLHFAGAGHLKEAANYRSFDSMTVAQEHGFTPCPLCFNQRLSLPYLIEEMQIGKECESTIRHYNLMSSDSGLQAKVERIGQKVLSNWPLPLKGYQYHFSVVENGDFNAVAGPGGYIFVNTGLLNALESDDELEAVLAHEIAHVEQRHSIKEYLKARSDANTAAVAGLIIGAATTAAVVSANSRGAAVAGEVAGGLSFLLMQAGSRIALLGYSREHEIEADVYALIYLQKIGMNKAPLISVVKKVRSSFELSNPPLNTSTLDAGTHPDPKTRLHILDSLECQALKPDTTFDAYTKDEELVYTVTLNAVCSYTQRDGTKVTKILSEVATTPSLGSSKSVEVLTVNCNKSSYEFKSDGVIRLEPLDSMGISFTRSNNQVPDFGAEFSPRLDGISVDRIFKRLQK